MRHNYNPLIVDSKRKVSSLIVRIFKHLEKSQFFDYHQFGFKTLKDWNNFKTTLMNFDNNTYRLFLDLLFMYFSSLHKDFCNDFIDATK